LIAAWFPSDGIANRPDEAGRFAIPSDGQSAASLLFSPPARYNRDIGACKRFSITSS
jgi:hypothetical protein